MKTQFITACGGFPFWKCCAFTLLLAGLGGISHAQQNLRISWKANSESNVAGYKVYTGTSSGKYTKVQDVGKVTTAKVAALAPETTHYFAVQAYNTAGLASNLSAEVSYKTLPAFAEISITDSAGASLVDGVSSVSLGLASIGSQDSSRKFSVSNLGTIDLTGLGTHVTGPHASDFKIEFATTGAIAPKGSAELVISLKPTAVGPRQATLWITSNDDDESPFEIQLSGIGGTPSAMLGSWATLGGLTGPRSLPGAIAHHDGVSNLIKYAFNLNAAAADVRVLVKGTGTAGLPAYDIESVGTSRFFRVEYIRRIGSGLIYSPKVSGNLVNYTAMTGTTTSTRIDDVWERVIVRQPVNLASQPKWFGRVEVTLPEVIVSPEIEISTSAGGLLANGSAFPPFPGTSPAAGEVYQTLFVTNRGTDYLSDLAVSIVGNPAFRVMDVLPPELAPGAFASLRIAFLPVSTGLHSASVRVTSNDADERLTEISLSALVSTPAQLFQSWAAGEGMQGSAAFASSVSSPEGVPNLLIYAFAMRSGGSQPKFLPSVSGNQKYFTVTYIRRKGSGLSYVPMVSSDLVRFTPMTGNSVVTDLDGVSEKVTLSMPVSASQRTMFGRVDVTLP